MAPGNDSTSRLRAIVAVIALYALLLQAFLGTLMPMPLGGGDHALCLSSAPVSGDSAPDTPHDDHAACCTAAHVAASALPPPVTIATLAWPNHRIATAVFRREATHGPRAPPRSIAHPRGPPVA